jgi:hypothetical protein
MRVPYKNGIHLVVQMAHLTLKGLSIMGLFCTVEWSGAYFGEEG